MSTLREVSRQSWNGSNTIEEINAGSLQRIADATEVISKRYQELVDDRDRYKRWYEYEQRRKTSAHNSIRALKGVITTLKKKLELANLVSS